MSPNAGTPTALPNGGTEFERVIDGTIAPLTFLRPDPDKPGDVKAVTENVKVKKISIQNMMPLAKAWGKYSEEVALYIGRTVEEVALLDESSFETAMSEGRRLNFTSFEKWYRWQRETLQALGQGQAAEAAIQNAVTDVVRQVAMDELKKSGFGS